MPKKKKPEPIMMAIDIDSIIKEHRPEAALNVTQTDDADEMAVLKSEINQIKARLDALEKPKKAKNT